MQGAHFWNESVFSGEFTGMDSFKILLGEIFPENKVFVLKLTLFYLHLSCKRIFSIADIYKVYSLCTTGNI